MRSDFPKAFSNAGRECEGQLSFLIHAPSYEMMIRFFQEPVNLSLNSILATYVVLIRGPCATERFSGIGPISLAKLLRDIAPSLTYLYLGQTFFLQKMNVC